jgi:hypothetical protein
MVLRRSECETPGAGSALRAYREEARGTARRPHRSDERGMICTTALSASSGAWSRPTGVLARGRSIGEVERSKLTKIVGLFGRRPDASLARLFVEPMAPLSSVRSGRRLRFADRAAMEVLRALARFARSKRFKQNESRNALWCWSWISDRKRAARFPRSISGYPRVHCAGRRHLAIRSEGDPGTGYGHRQTR